MKNKILSLLVIIFLLAGAHTAYTQIITTIAGGGTSGLGDGGPAFDCELDNPYGTAIDALGNLYIADEGGNRIRKVNTAGIITTIAGNGTAGYNGDGIAATDAELKGPVDVVVDNSGNVYIADNANYRVRKVDSAGIITTVAGNGSYVYNGDGIPATAATIYGPHGMVIDHNGNLLVCDDLNNRIRKISPATGGVITTIAGNGTGGYIGDGGPATSEEIFRPYGLALDVTGNIYIADLNNRIRKVDTYGIITTIAGTGPGGYNGDNIMATAADIDQPFGVAVDGANNVYIADVFNNRIRKINTAGIITTIAGTGTAGFSGDGGPSTAAKINFTGITVDNSGNIFIADYGNFRIRHITSTLSVNTVSGPIESLSIYPNPSTTGNFIAKISSTSDYNTRIVILNLMGEKVKEIIASSNQAVEVSVDVPNGIYFLSALTENGSVASKLVIQK